MRLGVNIDHVATVRQARLGSQPDPVDAARLAERSGADSIVCHLREDRRHIQDDDVARLIRACRRVNLEMSAAPSIVAVALRLRPAQVTLVPERRQELTTEGGLNVTAMRARLQRLIEKFQERRIDVSLFIDPSIRKIEAARAVGARIIELHTGCYANTSTTAGTQRELAVLQRAVTKAKALGLSVAAGHGLDYSNVRDIVAIRDIEELNIGFSIIARAVFLGLEQAVRHMKARMG